MSRYDHLWEMLEEKYRREGLEPPKRYTGPEISRLETFLTLIFIFLGLPILLLAFLSGLAFLGSWFFY